MLQKIQTQELLEEFMAGQAMTHEKLDELLENEITEDLFLEYKRSDVLNWSKPKRNHLIREYLSGFANSVGGLLIIGIDDRQWEITPCKNVSGDLARWAASCCTEIAYYFSPQPRFQVVEHPRGKVLVAATLRSSSLVPCRVGHELVYYLRFHDQTLDNKTLKVPDYLISDLMLGRRQRPYLHVRRIGFRATAKEQQAYNNRVLSFNFVLSVENEGLVWASDVKVGIVRQIHDASETLNAHLLSYIDVQGVGKKFSGSENYDLDHTLLSSKSHLSHIDLAPFSFVNIPVNNNEIPTRIGQVHYHYTWNAALYIMSRESSPVWYQIQLEINATLLQAVNERESFREHDHPLKIFRLGTTRPVVSWEGF